MQGFGTLKRLPDYFYDINAIIPAEGRVRWVDEFADAAPHIIQAQDMDATRARLKAERNQAYSGWIASKYHTAPNGVRTPLLKGKQMLFQVIQILERAHSETNSNDWWGDYRDALFRVFVQPETVYDYHSGEHKQWYLLSPEDSYLVNRYEIMKKNPAQLPPREYEGREKYLSGDRRLRDARLVPVECCRHWKHETSAGALPEGL